MDDDLGTYSHYSDGLPQTSTMRGSVRSTASLPGNNSFGSYYRYPYGNKFTDKSHSPKEEVNTFPENNSKAVVTALKGLQEKIHKLELDRSQAKANLDQLSSEANEYKKKLGKEREGTPPKRHTISPVEASNHLATTEAKCKLLEKQLEYMRTMVQSAEEDRNQAIHQTTAMAQQAAKQASEHIQNKLEKISGLERQHIKLNAAQSVAESKIRELEDKLVEERHKRKLIEDKTAELATTAEANRILMAVTSPSSQPKKAKKKKKVKKQLKPPTPPQPQSHYRLNMGDIPFIVGTSTAKSFNVGANVQGALSLLKTHNPTLCNAATKNRRKYCRTSSLPSDSDNVADINEVLLGLQDEFGNMGFEHKELLKQIQDTEDERLREDLERELDQLVAKMENKGEQIAMLKQHKERMARLAKRKKKRPTSSGKGTTREETKCVSVRGGEEVEVVTTVKTKTPRRNLVEQPTSVAKQNLDILRGMKKLQTSLRKDDLSWD